MIKHLNRCLFTQHLTFGVSSPSICVLLTVAASVEFGVRQIWPLPLQSVWD